MPLLAHRFLDQAGSGNLRLEWTSAELSRLRREIRRANRRTVNAVIGSALILAGAVIYGLDGYSPPMLLDTPLLTWLLGGAGIAMLVFSSSDSD